MEFGIGAVVGLRGSAVCGAALFFCFVVGEILVIGHRNPDTDSICSAIGYAEFKRLTGSKRVIAARCGDVNDRINFVLRRFGAAPPRFVADVSPKVRDVMQHQVSCISPGATASEALAMMEAGNLRVLPIVDEDRFCHGLISVFKMGKFLMAAGNRDFRSRRVVASIRALARALGAKLCFGVYADREEDLILMVGAMSRDSFAARLPNYPPEKLIVVVGDRRDIQELAVDHRVRAIIVTGDLAVEEDVAARARRNEVSLLVSPHDSATTVMLCRSAIGVGHMKHEHFLSFREDEAVAAIRDVAVSSQFQAFPVLDALKRVVGVLSKTDLLKRVDRKLILVDHNELSQAVKGADQVEIIEIIDHHRIGAFTSRQPMLFVNRPVGSTSTIVADLFFTYQLPLSKQIAGLLMAGLVSDTLNLTSPTTTELDAAVLSRLSAVTSIDPAVFTEQLFSSGSVLTGRPAKEAIAADCKEYTESGKKFSVAQIEEIGFKNFWERKEAVVEALESYRRENGCFFSSLLVTDVVRQSSLLLAAGPEEFLSRIHYPVVEAGAYELSGVVSRKKQLLPYLVHCLEHMMNGTVSLIAGRLPEEIVNMNQESLVSQDGEVRILLSSVEDHDVHEVLQRRKPIISALEDLCARKTAAAAGLIVSETNGEQSILIGGGDKTLLSRLDLPVLEKNVFSLNPAVRSKAAILSMFEKARNSGEAKPTSAKSP